MRRIYISPYSVGENSFNILGDLTIIDALRPSILYWDDVTVPVAMPGMLPQLEIVLNFLSGQGAINQYNIQEKNSMEIRTAMAVFAKDFLDTTTKLSMSGEGKLSILCPLGESQSLTRYFKIIVGEDTSTKNEKIRTLEMSLKNALPVPTNDVAFQDILEFKSRRKDQLSELQRSVELLAAQLSGVESLDDAVRIGHDTIQGALADIDRVFNEKWTKKVYSTLRANLGNIIVGSLSGVFGSPSLAIGALAGAAVGAAIKPVIQASVSSVIAARKIPESATPYLYAYEAGRELDLPHR